ncbi:MAG: T9SS type A sorting domain-containing protein, partial [Ignavibacteriaceae bacterium]|nr:T9SS type A sorting domain-containing protein [Ignavibacteriaceae bacterium]
KSYDSNDDIGQGYSTDGGYSWTTLWSLEGYTSTNEFAVDLIANQGGNNWHVCYTSASWWVYYSTRPQDLSTYWSTTPQVVNDIDWASTVYTKKSITSNWTTDIPGIAWADYRDGSPDYDIYYDSDGATTFQLTVNIANGWNMVSIPGLHPTDQNVNTWWAFRDPGANVFKYNAGYQVVSTAVPGTGYWMKHAGARTYNTGDEWPAGGIQIVPHNPIVGASGWNLFGGYELIVTAANVTTNPPGLQSGPIFKYSGGYAVATTIDPGYGYWIKLNSAGQIIIPETMAKDEVVEYFPEEWGRIVLTDATGINYTLYAVKGQVDLSQYELPPAPPAGMFDIRYSSGRIAEDINSSMKTIDMSGVTYPLTVRVEGMDIRLMDESGKMINTNLKSGEDIVISKSTIQKLMLSGELLPTVYSLEQNYPNPFNPSTVIEFSLPEDVANVKLSIFNMLGEKVGELVNRSLQAGKYQYQWNASNVATGMYIYELRTEKFVSVKKMVLVK